MIKSFNELPEYMKTIFLKWEDNNLNDALKFVSSPIPALNNKTIVELINEPDGEDKIIEYFNRAMDKIGVPLEIKKSQ